MPGRPPGFGLSVCASVSISSSKAWDGSRFVFAAPTFAYRRASLNKLAGRDTDLSVLWRERVLLPPFLHGDSSSTPWIARCRGSLAPGLTVATYPPCCQPLWPARMARSLPASEATSTVVANLALPAAMRIADEGR